MTYSKLQPVSDSNPVPAQEITSGTYDRGLPVSSSNPFPVMVVSQSSYNRLNPVSETNPVPNTLVAASSYSDKTDLANTNPYPVKVITGQHYTQYLPISETNPWPIRLAELDKTFDLPLKTTIVPTSSGGSATATFTRTTAAEGEDFEGRKYQVASGEVRFGGTRRVKNILGSLDFTSGSYTSVKGGTGTDAVITSGFTAPDGTATAYRLQLDRGAGNTGSDFCGRRSTATATKPIRSVWLKSNTGSTQTVGMAGNGASTSVMTVTTIWQRFATPTVDLSSVSNFDLISTGNNSGSTNSVDILAWDPQLEDVTGQSNINPSEFVSVGVLSAPYHGANVDGVKHFDTFNGNTVSSNVVTEATGAAISSATAKFGELVSTTGGRFTTTDAAANRIVGSVDLRFDLLLGDWTPGAFYVFYGKDGLGANRAIIFGTTAASDGKLLLQYTTDGTNIKSATSSAGTGFTDGTRGRVRATLNTATGDVTFYTSLDFVTWTQLGTVQSTVAGAIFNSTAAPTIGDNTPTGNSFPGRIYRAQIYNGIAGTLAVDFNPNTFASGTTWTSATTGEVWTINGNAKVFGGSGTSSIPAKWDADGPAGYKPEGARTNLNLQSGVFSNAAWTKAAGITSVTAAQQIAPDGTLTGWTFLAAAEVGSPTVLLSHTVSQDAVCTAVAHAMTVIAKAGTASWLGIGANGTAIADGAFFNLTTGVVGTTAASTTASMKALPNGWWACTIVRTLAAATQTMGIEIHTADNQAHNWTAAGTETIYVWQTQRELGAFATSIIPTTAAAVTRNADVLTYATAGNVSNTSGTFYCVFTSETPQGLSTQDRCLLAGTNTEGHPGYIQRSADKLAIYDGTAERAFNLVTMPTTSSQKAATSWGGVLCNGALNGVASTAKVFDGDIGLSSTMAIGIETNSGNALCGNIKNIKISAAQASDSALVALTTP